MESGGQVAEVAEVVARDSGAGAEEELPGRERPPCSEDLARHLNQAVCLDLVLRSLQAVSLDLVLRSLRAHLNSNPHLCEGANQAVHKERLAS